MEARCKKERRRVVEERKNKKVNLFRKSRKTSRLKEVGGEKEAWNGVWVGRNKRGERESKAMRGWGEVLKDYKSKAFWELNGSDIRSKDMKLKKN